MIVNFYNHGVSIIKRGKNMQITNDLFNVLVGLPG